jgi:hypothetical protein
MELETTGASPVIPEDALLRILCHLVIERLPADSLKSAWEHLYEAWEWHSRPRLPKPVDARVNVTPVRRVLPIVEERPFQIAEE